MSDGGCAGFLEVRNYCNYFRDYDSAVGRYVEGDSFGLEGGINTYGYVEQRPTMLSDATGLNPAAYRLAMPTRLRCCRVGTCSGMQARRRSHCRRHFTWIRRCAASGIKSGRRLRQ
ncbi:MAG: hypothetical protein EPO25_02350 [Gammaproteobacteria bacterium]|nr:MAG: hypothetical protein EPO25_02350 [Gammaproteobacteria bacterium]